MAYTLVPNGSGGVTWSFWPDEVPPSISEIVHATQASIAAATERTDHDPPHDALLLRIDDAPSPESIVAARLAEYPTGLRQLIDNVGGVEITFTPGATLCGGWHGDTDDQSTPMRMDLPEGLATMRSPPSPGGRRVEETPSLPGVFDHEIGHVIEAAFEAKAQERDPAFSLKAIYSAQEDAAAGLSRYVTHDRHEWFAECLAAWLHPAWAGAGYQLAPALANMLDAVCGHPSGRSDAVEKRTKESVDYSKGMPESKCDICRHFQSPDACTLVEGSIDPDYWCELFEKGSRGDATMTAGGGLPDALAGTDQGQIRGAGVMLLHKADDGDRALFVKHRERDTWEFPGGVVEDGETAAEAAEREVGEEIGASPYGRLSLLMRDRLTGVDYSTFQARVADAFTPTIGEELEGFAWASINQPPEPLHPGVRLVLERMRMNELDIARAIRDGRLSSPQQYENIWLFAMRVTGTGASYRPELNEHVWRDPGIYLNNDFLARCNGLPVIWEHPPGDELTQSEFEKRVIGTIMLPYLVQDEVWGVARIYDQDVAQLMLDTPLSTSPAVVFRDPAVNETRKLDGGKTLLIEGEPSLLDHLAVCQLGVWDRGGEATGIAVGEPEMAEGPEDELPQVSRLDRIGSAVEALHTIINRF